MARKKKATVEVGAGLSLAEVERASVVWQWIAEGHSQAEILRMAGERWRGVEVERLLERVMGTHLAEVMRTPREALLGWCVVAGREAFRRAMEMGEIGTAVQALRLMAGLAERLPKAGSEGARGVAQVLAVEAVPPGVPLDLDFEELVGD